MKKEPLLDRMRHEAIHVETMFDALDAEQALLDGIACIQQLQIEQQLMREALMKCKTCALPTEVRDFVNLALGRGKE